MVASEKPTSRGTTGLSRWDSNRAAWSRSARAPRPDNTHGTNAPGSGARGTSSTGGACSRMVCALVPLTPNDDTPHRRGLPVPGHGRASVSGRTAPEDQSTCGVGSSACRVGGSVPWRIAMTILITPATPAAAWVCPMFDFTEPSHTGRSAGLSRP